MRVALTASPGTRNQGQLAVCILLALSVVANVAAFSNRAVYIDENLFLSVARMTRDWGVFPSGEWVFFGGVAPLAAFAAGAVIFLAAKALKWWAIVSLGRFWTFRVIVIPGARLVAAGPYRWMRHPNYAGVMGELAGVALMTGAAVSGLAGIVTFGALVVRRIATEERALQKATR